MIRICPHCDESYTYAHTCASDGVLMMTSAGFALVTRCGVSDPPRDCVHGQLARVCLTCEHEREIADLKEQVRLLTGRLRDVQRAMQGWP